MRTPPCLLTCRRSNGRTCLSGRVSGKRASHFRVIKRERRACDGSVGAGYLRNDDPRNLEQLHASLDSVKIEMSPALRAENAALSRTPPPATDRSEEQKK